MSTALKLGSPPVMGIKMARKHGSLKASKLKVFAVDGAAGDAASFPSFLPEEVEKIKDPFARSLSKRMQRLPVQVSHLHQDLFIYSTLQSTPSFCFLVQCASIFCCVAAGDI